MNTNGLIRSTSFLPDFSQIWNLTRLQIHYIQPAQNRITALTQKGIDLLNSISFPPHQTTKEILNHNLFQNQTVKIQLPPESLKATVEGVNLYEIYQTLGNFGTVGILFFLNLVNVLALPPSKALDITQKHFSNRLLEQNKDPEDFKKLRSQIQRFNKFYHGAFLFATLGTGYFLVSQNPDAALATIGILGGASVATVAAESALSAYEYKQAKEFIDQQYKIECVTSSKKQLSSLKKQITLIDNHWDTHKKHQMDFNIDYEMNFLLGLIEALEHDVQELEDHKHKEGFNEKYKNLKRHKQQIQEATQRILGIVRSKYEKWHNDPNYNQLTEQLNELLLDLGEPKIETEYSPRKTQQNDRKAAAQKAQAKKHFA